MEPGVSGARRAELAESLAAVEARVARACADAGRARDAVELLPVTKFFPSSDVEILYGLGARAFAESREQEASVKVADVAAALDAPDIRWHMVGRLQRNKAKAVARWASVVQSVDGHKLVDALERGVRAALDDGARSGPLSVYLQVSLDGDTSRGGVAAADLASLGERVSASDSLDCAGLMAVAPLGADAERAFADLAGIRDRFVAEFPHSGALSAGMTGDLEAAIAHGSTLVRVGTAILGSRPIVSP
ncbi:hypothetical protein Rrhod_0457 [Rhodococcus rhodnii LMG 5362]|uniref:Pyridoxal phosphate homeostasis protein n=1 Tax=Rhodococcus rhodnii LMG 5362 TaxID=1273125 RepID=R7WS10_9NOCA|nr:hypothetical protein Rrhod_0457 [Rhodococcus rhodnii LMG 5362]